MIWPFKKEEKEPVRTIYFRSGPAFHEYQCKYGHTEIAINAGIPALVLNAQEAFGIPAPVIINPDGTQLAALRVASKDGGFLVFASAPAGSGERLEPGDVVIWVPFEYLTEVGSQATDPRTGWSGLIRAKVSPEISLENPNFVISCRYD